MDQRHRSNFILIGFSTTGKSRVGRMVAQELGLGFVDTDDEIVVRAGKPIDRIFEEDGEARFRELERSCLAEACAQDGVVIATGGGVPVDPRNCDLMRRRGFVVCLEATTETILRRHRSDDVARPLLDGKSLAEVAAFHEARRRYYSIAAHWTLPTDGLSQEEVAAELAQGWRRWGRDAACIVQTPSESYPVFCGWGELERLGGRMADAGLSGRATIVSDENVAALYGQQAEDALQQAGFEAGRVVVPPGEASKSLETASQIYDHLVGWRIERGQAIVALGGGMVGDLAGFVAATYLRGLPLVQGPTSLLAMVDAAVGGKVAVDHPQAKNLIGAFYQPRLVVADTSLLLTLPRRELVSGLAEVVKHGLILDASYFEFLEAEAEAILQLDRDAITEAVERSMALKAAVVSEDPHEQARRIILNYGHTIGHAIEAATGYGNFLHGEAVAIGIVGAAMISHRMGLIPAEAVRRQRALLQRLGLPTSCPGVEAAAILEAMTLDKKVRGKAIRWVLLEDIGRAVVRDDVPQELAEAVVAELIANSAGIDTRREHVQSQGA